MSKYLTRQSITLFILGLAIGGGLGALLHKETIIVRQGTAETPAALTSVDLMIDYGTGTVKTWNTVSWHESMSVLGLMEEVAGASAIKLLTQEDKQGISTVNSIDNIANDTKANMRWQYWVNNTYEPRIASKYYIKPGDIVMWKYVKEQTQ